MNAEEGSLSGEEGPLRAERRRARWTDMLAGALVVVAVVWLYARALQPDFDFVSLDDAPMVIENPAVRHPSWSAAWSMLRDPRRWWSGRDGLPPLTTMSLMFDGWLTARQGVPAATAFHRTAVMLHVLNAVLVFGLMRRMGAGSWAAAAIAGVFACHPMQVEAVAWVARREVLLGACLSLLAVRCYLERTRCGWRGGAWFTASMVFCVLATLASPKAAMLPIVLLLLDTWPLQRELSGAMFEKLPLLLVMVLGPLPAVIRAGYGDGGVVQGATWMARNGSSLLDRLVWPTRLSPFYPAGASGGVAVALAGVGVVAFVIASVWAWRRWRPMGVGLLAFAAMAIPWMWTAKHGGLVRDHAAYFAMVFLLIPLAIWTRRQQRVMAVAACAVVLGVVAVPQIETWRDGESLFRYAAKLYPESGAPRGALGEWLVAHGRANEAEPLLREAALMEPEDGDYRLALGHALRARNQMEEARGEFERAVELNPQHPRYRLALASTLANLGRWKEAQPHYEMARDALPGAPEIRLGLGFTYLSLARPAAARAEFQEALKERPSDPRLHLGLACAWARMEQWDQCRAHLTAAVTIDHSYAAKAGLEPELRALADRPGFEGLIALPREAGRQTAKPRKGGQ